MHKRFLSTTLATAVVAALAAAAPAAAQDSASQDRFTLTVLHHNDGESQLVDAGSGELEEFGGVAKFETLVRERRRSALCGGRCGSIMVSSGDNFLAGPEFNASLEKGVPFYDALAMKRIGYDAITIGNHEFDFGPEILSGFIRGFPTRMPFVSANLDVSGAPGLVRREEEGRIARSVVVRERGRRISEPSRAWRNVRAASRRSGGCATPTTPRSPPRSWPTTARWPPPASASAS